MPRFNGVAGGTFSSPTLAGTLVAEDFEFTMPATSRTPEQQVHWDSLAASIQFSSHELALRGGSLRRGDTSADFEVSAVLQKGQFTEDSPYTARVNLHNVDVASTAALAGFDYPISGTADVSLQVSGTRAHPQAQGHIHAANASAYGEAIEKFDADLHIAERTRPRSIIFTSPIRMPRFLAAPPTRPATRRLPARPRREEFRLVADSPDSSGSLAHGRARRFYPARRPERSLPR